MKLARLIIIPILTIAVSAIDAGIRIFSFWFCRILLPEQDPPPSVYMPQTAEEVEQLMPTPRWDEFLNYLSRSYLLVFIIETISCFLLSFLFGLYMNRLVDTSPSQWYDWKFIVKVVLPIALLLTFGFFMAYRSARKNISGWRYNSQVKQTREKQDTVISIGQDYARFVNYDKSRNKILRRKMLLIVAGAVALPLCLVGLSKYRFIHVNFKLGDNAFRFREYEYTLQEDGTARIDRYTDQVPADLVLPAELYGAPVTSIGKEAFAKQPGITQVTVPEGVTTISDGAFKFCDRLERVILPQSLETIEPRAFIGCWKAEQIDLPAGLKHIGDYAFNSCHMLSAVSIPESVETIGEWAFSGTNIKEITIPAGVDSLGTGAFSDCCELTRVTILNGSLELDGRSFYGCTSLAEVDLPADAAVILRDMALFSIDGKRLIAYWGKATAYAVPDDVEEICDYAFKSCSTLKRVTFPKGLRRIGKSAFESCGLEQIDLPDGLRELGADAFSGCSSLTNIVVPDSLTMVDISSFPLVPKANLTITIPPSVRKVDRSGALYMDTDKVTFRVVRGSAADTFLQMLANTESWDGKKVFKALRIQYYDPQTEKKATP